MKKVMLAALLLGGCTTARTAAPLTPTTASPALRHPPNAFRPIFAV